MISTAVKMQGRFVTQPEAVKRDMGDAMFNGVKRATFLVYSALKKEMTGQAGSDPFWGKTGGLNGTFARRTGHTIDNLSPPGRVYRFGNQITGAVGSPDEHVRMQEEGGTIYAKAGRYLRVPTREAQTSAGVDRNAGHSVRGLAGYFIVRTHGGRAWIAQRKGPRAAITLLYLLIKSVRVKARHIFARVTAMLAPRVALEIGARIGVVCEKANR